MIAGFTLLARAIQDDTDRIAAFSIAGTGFTVGYLCGYPLGSVLYEMTGRYVPFLILLAFGLIDVSARLVVPTPARPGSDETSECKGILSLLRDPHVVLVSFLSVSACCVAGIIMATLPKYLMDTSEASQWQIGTLYTVATGIEAVVQIIVSRITQHHFTRVLIIITSFGLHTAGLIIFTLMSGVWWMLVPLTLTRVAEGTFTALVTSLMTYISDVRAIGSYHHLYAIYVASYSLALSGGPMVAGTVVSILGFHGLCYAVACITILSALVSLLLLKVRSKSTANESSQLLRADHNFQAPDSCVEETK